MPPRQVYLYDTTLRDGTQAEDFNLSLADKIRVALKLDDLGIHYIEGGWPGSNPKDEEFFAEIRNYELKRAKIAAFGSTHHPEKRPEHDANLRALVAAKTPVVTIFGKSWTVHVKEALRTTLDKNLEIIRDSLAFLRPSVETLFLRRRTLLRRVSGQPRVRAGDPGESRGRRGGVPDFVRHEWRQSAVDHSRSHQSGAGAFPRRCFGHPCP